MPLHWEQVVIDARDPHDLARWWCQALDWIITYEDESDVEIRSDVGAAPAILFLPVPEDRVTKNRLHLDFRPTDQEVEVNRLLNLGATLVDVGQGEVSWVVLADPEGNEFCILCVDPALDWK